MSNAEAAASLFSTDDSPSDPFATLGSEESPSDFSAAAPNDDASLRQADNVFNNFEGYQEPASSGSDFFAIQDNGYPSHSHASPYDNAQPEHPTATDSHWNYSEQTYSGNSFDTHSYSYAPLPKHDPYAPPSISGPTSQLSQSHQHSTTYIPSSNTSTENSYNVPDRYAPPTTSHDRYGNYSVSATANMQSNTITHGSMYANTQTTSIYPSPPATQPVSLPTVPVPTPAPTNAQVTRPRILNAYDPPFLSTVYNKRHVSAPTRSVAGNLPASHSAYTAYQSTSPPPPAPPPPRMPVLSSTYSHPPPVVRNPSPYVPPPHPANKLANPSAPTEKYSVNPYPLNAPALPPSASYAPSSQAPSFLQPPPPAKNTAGGSTFETFPDQMTPAYPVEETGEDSKPDVENVTAGAVPPPNIPLLPSAPGTPKDSDKDNDTSSWTNVSMASSPEKRSSTSPIQAVQNLGDYRQSSRPSSRSSLHKPFIPSYIPSDEKRDVGDSEARERIPRARTASPSISGMMNGMPNYNQPKGEGMRPKSASLASMDRVIAPDISASGTYDRYAPRGARVSNVYGFERAGSPNSFLTRSSDDRQGIKPPSYLPPVSESIDDCRSEVMPYPGDPYAPVQQKQSEIQFSQDSGGYTQTIQEVTVKSTITAYAPSPSLVGANDPLRRTFVQVPVISFGFGGKLVTCFHKTDTLNTGFDVALSSRTSTKVKVQNWKSLVPESALDFAPSFPGPLHGDPVALSTGIMKSTASAQAKAKKSQVIKYLSDRADEIAQGLSYLHPGSIEGRSAEGKLILVKLLKLMVENDGRLLGTTQLDTAVRVAVVPRLEGSLSTSAADSGTVFKTTADSAGVFLGSLPYGTIPSTSGDSTISVTTLRQGALDKIEEFLLRGERRQAYHYALDERLWAHAMVIASSIDKEAWKEVVNEFLKTELGGKGERNLATAGLAPKSTSSVIQGRDSLRVVYSLFSGQGAFAVQELVPQNVLGRSGVHLPIPAQTLAQATPISPNFMVPMAGSKIPAESLAKWPEIISMMIASPLTNDISTALTALGDQLLANGWLEAAHVCYLLSPQTSPLGGIGNPAARIILLGSRSPATAPTFLRDSDCITLTEVLEYALSAVPTPKGQEPNYGIPHLQPYRLIHAFAAAEAGELQIAGRYCEAITSSITKGSSHFTSTMLDQLRGLADRLAGVSHSDRSSSWMSGKLTKPSLDTIGGWLEGRFTKLVTGDSDASSLNDETTKANNQALAGPFAHYNTISSATSSARSSPQPTFIPSPYAAPQRTGSAMSNKSPYGYQSDRQGISMESTRRVSSPGPQSSASIANNLYTPMDAQIQSYGNGYNPVAELPTPKAREDDNDGHAQEVTWWGSAGYDDVGRTPTTAQYEKAGEVNGTADSDGFFSLMDSPAFGPSSQASSRPSESRKLAYEDEDDDLGLGNNTNKRKRQVEQTAQESEKQVNSSPVKEEKPPESKPTQPASSSGSWFFGRWWRRSEGTTGPVRASLGEESSFYYDKELKRWVNKKAGAEASKPAPTPPPPRARTASPAVTTSNGHSTNGQAGTNEIDLTITPPSAKMPLRARSNLAPPGIDSAPPTPTGTRLAPSGNQPIRPKSQASGKRSVRSRYVDVFAPENGNTGV